jgi:predicted short-subunit dehydrogenase-like oxidoreductase (DUF2520 family)
LIKSKRVSVKKRILTVSIVGAGRLGTAMAIALAGHGYAIGTLVARRRQQVQRSAAFFDPPIDTLVAKELHQLQPPNLLIIATPDDQITPVARVLSAIEISRTRKPTVLHTSGALSSQALYPLAQRGWRTGSIHPLVSVSEPISGAQSLRGASWCVEGDRQAVRVATALIRDLEGKSFSISSDVKPLYHAAAVMASGNVVALFDVAVEMLGHCGLEQRKAQRVLLPLLSSSIRNLTATNDPAKAMTGTFARGDLETVKLHLEALSDTRLIEARELYRLLGQRALKMAEKNGLERRMVRRIAGVLKR